MARPAPDSHDLFVWRLDESGPPFLNTGTVGSAGDLVQVGSVTPSIPAIWGNGVQFSGTSGNYLRTADTTDGEVLPLSMCVWVYPKSVVNGVDGCSVLQKQIKNIAGDGPSYWCSVGINMPNTWTGYHWERTPILKTTFANNNQYNISQDSEANGLQFFENTQWYMVSVNIIDQWTPIARHEIFLNGRQNGIFVVNNGSGINWGSHGPWIVGNNTVNGVGFNGIIGEIRISDVIRPPSYWRQYYAAGVDSLAGEECTLEPNKPRSILPVYE